MLSSGYSFENKTSTSTEKKKKYKLLYLGSIGTSVLLAYHVIKGQFFKGIIGK